MMIETVDTKILIDEIAKTFPEGTKVVLCVKTKIGFGYQEIGTKDLVEIIGMLESAKFMAHAAFVKTFEIRGKDERTIT